MKIHVLSDLHTEGAKFRIDDVGADAVILAGDTINGRQPIREFDNIVQKVSARTPIFAIPGNHEFYGTEWMYGQPESSAWTQPDRVTYGTRMVVALTEGVRILMCSLWTDFELYGNSHRAMIQAREGYVNLQGHRLCIRDFSPGIIEDDGGPLKPYTIVKEHLLDRAWLEAYLDKPFDGKTVVVTHFVPTEHSIAEMFKGDPLSPYFCCKCDDLIAKADVWIHGHTHTSFDYEHPSGCRVVCNPRAYMRTRDGGPENPHFDPHLVIEV